MRRIIPIALLFTALAGSLLAACGGDAEPPLPEDALAVRASSDVGLGPERVLIGIRTPDRRELASADLTVEFRFVPENDPDADPIVVDGIYTELIPGATGLYRATVDFDQAGVWNVTLVPEGGDPLDPVPIMVQEDPSAPAIGDPAPPSESPTLDDLTLPELTTDPEPEPSFYEMSIAEAVTSGRSSVVVFATPAYCQTATCGPMLDQIKEVSSEYPDVNFVHVEVYTGLTEPDFAPDAEHLAQAVVEWRLLSEPWAFVVDETGTVVARFEGTLAAEELEQHLG